MYDLRLAPGDLQVKPGITRMKTRVCTYLHAVSVGGVRYVSLTLLLARGSPLWPLQSGSVDQFQPSIAPGNRGLSIWLLQGYAARFARLPRFAPRAPEFDHDGLETTEAWDLEVSEFSI